MIKKSGLESVRRRIFPAGWEDPQIPRSCPGPELSSNYFLTRRHRGLKAARHCSGDGRAGCGAWGGFPPISCRLTLQLCLRIVHHHIFHSDPKYTFSLGPEIRGALSVLSWSCKYLKNAEERKRKAQLDHHCTRHWLRPLSWTKLVAIVLSLLLYRKNDTCSTINRVWFGDVVCPDTVLP